MNYQAHAVRVIELGSPPKHRRRSSAASAHSASGPSTPNTPTTYTAVPTRKIVIVGDGAAGKTSLLQAFARNAPTSPDYIPTVFDSYTVAVQVDGGAALEVTLWDTAGQEDYDRLRPLSYADADAVLIAYSVEHAASLRNVVDKWAPEIRHYLPGCPITLVGLKTDLRDDPAVINVANSKKQPVSTADGERTKQAIGAQEFVECSAKTGHNVNDVFLKAVKTMQGVKHRRSGSLLKRFRDAFSCFPPFAEPQVID